MAANSSTETQVRGGVTAVGLTILAVVVLVAMCHRPPPAEIQAKADAPLISSAKGAVRDRLKDPGSAQFGTVTISRAGPAPAACGQVNAKNGFGGYTGDRRFVDVDGSAVLETDLPAASFAALWGQSCPGL